MKPGTPPQTSAGRSPEPGETDGSVVNAQAGRAAAVLTQTRSSPLAPGLYLVATPIGNLADITLRALAVLAEADAVYCEDTRRSRVLLSHYAINRSLKSYHEHNAKGERPRILAALAAGKSIALISDAGTPLVSDPGFKLVSAARDAGHPVTAVPGASAVLAALASCGLATDRFFFEGFLPVKPGARRTRLSELKRLRTTAILFEAPSRLTRTLRDIDEICGNCDVALARELTKLHEEIRRGTPGDLVEWVEETQPKGEFVIVVGPSSSQDVDDAAITCALQIQLEHSSLRDAVAHVTQQLGLPRARVYQLALALKSAAEE